MSAVSWPRNSCRFPALLLSVPARRNCPSTPHPPVPVASQCRSPADPSLSALPNLKLSVCPRSTNLISPCLAVPYPPRTALSLRLALCRSLYRLAALQPRVVRRLSGWKVARPGQAIPLPTLPFNVSPMPPYFHLTHYLEGNSGLVLRFAQLPAPPSHVPPSRPSRYAATDAPVDEIDYTAWPLLGRPVKGGARRPSLSSKDAPGAASDSSAELPSVPNRRQILVHNE